jgi:putative two-component system response regulator
MNSGLNVQTVLVVDDLPENIDVLSNLLSGQYRVKAANNGNDAIKIACQFPPDIILLDVMMPVMDGYEVCRQLKNDPRTRRIPVIFITAIDDFGSEEQGFSLGAVDYITKPLNPSIVLARLKTHLQLYDQNRVLEEKVKQRTNELDSSRLEIIRRLGRAAEYRDNETGLHVIRMSYYSRIIAEAIGLNNDECDTILNAAPMHDIGKIGIPDKILLKPGPLDAEETAIMRKHAEFGAGIIGEHDNLLLKAAHSSALTHHEQWNGKGYPQGLIGEKIPLIGRIIAVADVFDAVTSKRPYKSAWPIEKAIELINREKGHHFDPKLATAFLDNIAKVKEIMEKHGDVV